MTLRIYNTLTRTKEDFVPLDPKNVRMYVCGPTVYDYAHIGNARPAIVFDVLFRLLRHLYGENHVKYVRNITDVDDKINARALRDFPGLPLNEAIRKVTETTANQYFADTRALGCLDPTEQPRATEHIQGMVDMISVLIKKGHAYVAGGEVLFDVAAMTDYGKLSGRKLDEQQAGARIAVEAHKKNPADFVLWKLSSAEEPGWESPWGRGRPGWHIECSVMSKSLLGETFDIHGGGLDLIFPHHENEIAQSRCAHGTKVMANYWMHNGFLQVEGQKMSKSVGNFYTIQQTIGADDFGQRVWEGEVVRLAMLMTNYRQPIDWSVKRLREAEDIMVQWKLTVSDLVEPLNTYNLTPSAFGPDTQVLEALFDDLNTHLAIQKIDKIAQQLRQRPDLYASFVSSLELLGLSGGVQASSSTLDIPREQIVRLVEDRLLARHNKDWKESDRIRDELAAMGIAIKDNKDGTTTWEVKR
jgi:cysteinyl-tRNA synthetase